MPTPSDDDKGRLPHSLVSIAVFNVYVFMLGFGLLLVPEFFLKLFGFPYYEGLWTHVSGMLLLGYGVFYIGVVRERLVAFLPYSVFVRCLVIVFFSAFVLLGWAPLFLLVFGVIDLAAAIWTALALRAEGLNAR